MSDKKETEESGLTTEEAKELELDEQPKPTRHHSGHHSPPMSYNEETGRAHKKRQRENEIARNKFCRIVVIVHWLNTEKGRNTVTEHREHEKYFKHTLSSENLAKMTENEFSEFYNKLWTSNMWRNKDWYIKNKLISPNGLEKIKNEFEKPLYISEDMVWKYNNFSTL